jgi:hypothetical protein
MAAMLTAAENKVLPIRKKAETGQKKLSRSQGHSWR